MWIYKPTEEFSNQKEVFWVKATERLPDKGQEFLAYDSEYKVYRLMKLAYSYDNKIYFNSDYYTWDNLSNAWWTPLPKIPCLSQKEILSQKIEALDNEIKDGLHILDTWYLSRKCLPVLSSYDIPLLIERLTTTISKIKELSELKDKLRDLKSKD